MLSPEFRLECLRLAIAQASPSPLYLSRPDAEVLLADGDKWSVRTADETLALAKKYAEFLETGAAA